MQRLKVQNEKGTKTALSAYYKRKGKESTANDTTNVRRNALEVIGEGQLKPEHERHAE